MLPYLHIKRRDIFPEFTFNCNRQFGETVRNVRFASFIRLSYVGEGLSAILCREERQICLESGNVLTFLPSSSPHTSIFFWNQIKQTFFFVSPTRPALTNGAQTWRFVSQRNERVTSCRLMADWTSYLTISSITHTCASKWGMKQAFSLHLDQSFGKTLKNKSFRLSSNDKRISPILSIMKTRKARWNRLAWHSRIFQITFQLLTGSGGNRFGLVASRGKIAHYGDWEEEKKDNVMPASADVSNTIAFGTKAGEEPWISNW